MGTTPSREVLCSSGESQESGKRSFRNLVTFFKVNRLVRDELREEVQLSIRNKKKTSDSVPILQKPSKSLQ
jgi:hypothetical protein